MQIEKIKTSDLIPYAKNAKLHSDSQVAAIAGSVREFGFNNPVLIDKDNGIIAGHGRVLAAQLLKLDEVPCIRLSHLTETQKRAYILADNRLSETGGGWNEEMLKLELGELQELDFDLSLTGFDGEFMAGLEEPKEGLTDPDEVPPVPDEPVARLGDIWKLGSHRLMCGDSTDILNQDAALNGDTPNTVIFDPPFEIENIYSYTPTFTGDIKNLISFYDFKRCATAGHAAIVAGWNPLYEFIWDNCGSWYNENRPLARHKACHLFGTDPKWNFDAAIIADGKDRKASKSFTGKYKSKPYEYVPLDGAVHLSTVFVQSKNANKPDQFHSQEKPNDWLKAILLGCDAISVFDMFAGSGAVLIACESLGIKCASIELDPQRCDVIIKRWEDFTGKKAELMKK